MTTATSTSIPSTRGALRPMARHPVAATLIIMFGVAYALLIPPALTGLPLEPFLLGVVLFGQLLPAVLVTAAAGGRQGVRDLFARTFRWRFSLLWWLVALLAIPAASLLVTTALFGTDALHGLVTDPSVIVAYLGQLTILPIVNLWEETAWTGVVQDRVSRSRGSLLGALIVGPLVAFVHLPLYLGRPLGAFLFAMSLLVVLSTGLRILIGWLYSVTGRSVLIAAVTHVTFNATQNNDLLTSGAPKTLVIELVPPAVVVVLAALVVLFTHTRKEW